MKRRAYLWPILLHCSGNLILPGRGLKEVESEMIKFSPWCTHIDFNTVSSHLSFQQPINGTEKWLHSKTEGDDTSNLDFTFN